MTIETAPQTPEGAQGGSYDLILEAGKIASAFSTGDISVKPEGLSVMDTTDECISKVETECVTCECTAGVKCPG